MLKFVSIDYVLLSWECKGLLRTIKTPKKINVPRPMMGETAYNEAILRASPDLQSLEDVLPYDPFSAEANAAMLVVAILGQDMHKLTRKNHQSRANRKARSKEVWRLEVVGKLLEKFLWEKEARQKPERRNVESASKK